VDELERDICRFVSETVGMRLDRVHLTSTLGKDFGLDGDDAVEFFEAYANAFQVDVTGLRVEWSEFFGPEASGGGATGLLFLAPFVVAAASVFLVQWIFGFPWPNERALVVLILGGVLLLAWRRLDFWPYEKLFPLPKQITVAELIEAARRGRWQ